MTAFLVVGGIGLALLAASLVFDGLEHLFAGLEVLGFADGLLSVTALGSAATIFGASGLIVTSLGLPELTAVPVALALAVAAWLGVARLVRAVKRAARGGVRRLDLVGRKGRTLTAVTASVGEVILDSERDPRLARTVHGGEIAAGAEVWVTAMEGSRIVVTQGWPTRDPGDERR